MDIKEVINYLSNNSDKLIEKGYTITMTVSNPKREINTLCFGCVTDALMGIFNIVMGIEKDFLQNHTKEEWAMLVQQSKSCVAFAKTLVKRIQETEGMT